MGKPPVDAAPAAIDAASGQRPRNARIGAGRVRPGLLRIIRNAIFLLLVLAVSSLPVFPAASAEAGLTLQEKRGRHIYLKTTSPSGSEIRAVVGKGAIEAPGSTLTCVSCHGFEGEGLSQHGITATSITWEDLILPVPQTRDRGREHPPYTEAAVARAILEGLDPAGNRLNEDMPRYRMPPQDLDDLIAYLKVIGKAFDPGITDTSVKVGTIQPFRGAFAEMGRVMKAVLEAYFEEINAGGGIFNRRIELISADSGGTPREALAALQRLIDQEEVFAVVSPFTIGADTDAAALSESREVPVIGPFTIYPEDVQSLHRYTFYLLSGMREQARAQVVYSRELLGDGHPQVAIVTPEQGVPEDIVEAMVAEGAAYDWKVMERVSYTPVPFPSIQLASRLQGSRTEAIYFLGAWDQLQALTLQMERLEWFPLVFISGVQVREEIFKVPSRLTKRIFITYPTLSSDRKAEGMRELEALSRKIDPTMNHLAARVSACCAAKVLVRGIKDAGGKLSREKLIQSLDKLYQFETRLIPPITYHPNRRIGVLGAHMVTVDLEKHTFLPLGRWIALD